MRRSVVFAAPRRVEVQRSEPPAPGPGEVLVETELSAISAGTELLVYRGQAPQGIPADDTISGLQGELRYPLKYGYSAVGRAGERRVFAFHPHESCFAAPAETLVDLPEGLPAESAVFLPNMETAVNLVQDGRPMVGERVAVFGLGVVGLLTTALLARFPLADLVAVDPIAERRALATGATGHEPTGEFDLVYEVSGRPETLDEALAVAGFGARVVVGSWYGTKSAPLDLGGPFHRRRLKILSSQVSTLDPALTGAWTKRRRLDVALRLLHEIDPRGLITHRFPLDRAAEAYDLLDRGGALQVVLQHD